MHASFIIAGLIFVATLAMTVIVGFAAAMSDAPQENSGAVPLGILISGTILAIIVAGSHWLNLSW